MPIETPPPNTPQQLVVGSVLSSKYGILSGYTGGSMTAPLGQLSGIFLGQPDSGKSHLIQSCTDGYIFNLDGATTSGPELRAMLWPGVGKDGRLLGDNGLPIVFTWQHIIDRVEVLKQLSATNSPRPKTVFFDTLFTGIRLAKDHKVKISGKTSWRELDGRSAWDDIHEMVIGMNRDLKNAGYGVFWNAHIVNAKTPLGEDRYAYQWELSGITANFWSKIYPMFEFVGVCRSEFQTTVKEIDVEVKVRDEVKTVKQKTNERERIFYLTTLEEEFAGLTKAKVQKPLPQRIILPKNNAWATLEAVYAEHARG